MSLIHDALKEMETSASAEKAPAVLAPTVTVPHGSGLNLKLGSGSFGGILAGVVVGVGVAAVCVAVWQVYAVEQPIQVSAVPTPVKLPQPVQIATSPTAIGWATAAPKKVSDSNVDQSGAATTALSKENENRTAISHRMVSKAYRHSVRHVAKVPPAAVQSAPVEPSEAQLFQSFNAALADHDLSRARVLLGRLDARMPSNSVTLMRARAWLAVQSGEPERAMQEYAQILRRLPDDENASLNLAALQNQAGHRSQARKIVNNLLLHNPDSVRANRMLATLQEGDR